MRPRRVSCIRLILRRWQTKLCRRTPRVMVWRVGNENRKPAYWFLGVSLRYRAVDGTLDFVYSRGVDYYVVSCGESRLRRSAPVVVVTVVALFWRVRFGCDVGSGGYHFE